MSTEHLAGQPVASELDPKQGEVLPPENNGQQPALQIEEIEDVDEVDLRTAQTEAGAEEPDGRLQPTQEGTDPKEAKPTAAAGAESEEQKPKGQLIAKARFDEVLGRSKAAEEELARSKARESQLEQQLAKFRPPEVNSDLVRIEAKMDDLAKQFDDGAITYTQLIQAQRPLQAEQDRIREETISARAAERAARSVTPAAPSTTDQIWVEEKIADVVAKYGPYIEAVPEFLIRGVTEQARANVLAREGKIPPGPRGDAAVREEFGRLCMEGHEGFARLSGTQPIKNAGNGQPQPRPTPGNQPTPEQRRDKLALQERAHPSLSEMQRTIGSDTTLTDAQIEEMDEEEIANLPAAIRRRYLETND